MNKFYIFIFAILLISCKENRNSELNIPIEQKIFSDSINNFCINRAKERNAIKDKEIYDSYIKWINSFSDSLVFVNNWKGKIKGVKIKDAPELKATSIEFDLELPLKDDRLIEIAYKKYITKGKENQNLIYNQLKSIKSKKNVTFDGTFCITTDRKIKFGGIYGVYENEGNNICQPHLEMIITSIKPDSISDSPNLRNMKKFVAEQMRITEMTARKKITPAEAAELIKNIEKQKEELKEKLSLKENEEVNYLASELYLKILN